MKVVVTGASGLLGRAVLQKFTHEGHQVHGVALTRSTPTLTKLDLTDFNSVETFLTSIEPDLIIHTAAERRPDKVEKDPIKSNLLNVDVPSHLANFCKAGLKSQPLLINISTDYVFDGNSPPYKVSDPPNPLNAYGTSKLLGERAIQENGLKGRAVSLRVPVLYGETETPSESAVNILLSSIRPSSTPILCDASAVRYPTNVSDVSSCLYSLSTLTSNVSLITLPPILHFQSKEAMKKHDMCIVMDRVNNIVIRDQSQEYWERFRTSVDHLIPEYTVDNTKPGSVLRPKHCKMDMEELELLGIEVECVGFEDWWREYLTKEHKARIEQEAKEAEEKRISEEKELARIKAQEEAEAEEKKKKEAEEAEEKRKKEKTEAEERRVREEAEEKERRKLQEAEEEEEENRNQLEKEKEEAEKKRNKEMEGNNREEEESRDQTPVLGNSETVLESEIEVGTEASTTRPSSPSRNSTSHHENENPLSPSSPNPSFSSLRARPTPPTTSLNSPTTSLPPSIHEGITGHSNRDGSNSATPSISSKDLPSDDTKKVSSLSDSNKPIDSPLSLNPELNKQKTQERSSSQMFASGSGSGSTVPFGQGDASSYFPGPGDKSNQINTSITPTGDGDSDGYGQPSPRISDFNESSLNSQTSQSQQPSTSEEGSTSLHPDPSTSSSSSETNGTASEGARNSLSQNGFGEVPFGLDETEEKAETPHPQHTDAIPRPPLPKPKKQNQEPELPWFQVKVGDPQKVGDPMTAHIVYTVRTRTNSDKFKSSQFSVLRRYSDFRWLHAALVHCHPGIFVPPVPEKVKLGRFQPELVEARRVGLENAINKMLKHKKLYDDEDLKMFLESGNFSADVKSRELNKGAIPTPEQKTYFGWSSAITNATPKFHEFDEWFDSQRMYLDSLELQLKQLVKAVSAVAQQRKELAVATSDFSGTLMALSFSSLSRSLSTCFAGLGELEKRTGELTDIQSDADVRQIGTVIYEYERMVGSVRKAFATRVDSWIAWQRSNEEFSKTKAKHEKLKRETGGRIHPDRLHSSLSELADIESKNLDLKREFEMVSMTCKEEMERFDKVKVDDFKLALGVWIDGMIERQEEIISEWEQYNALLERQSSSGQPPSQPSQAQPQQPAQNSQPDKSTHDPAPSTVPNTTVITS